MSDMSRDPKTHIEDAMREVRTAMGQLRESVVMLVMRRNRLGDESRRQERTINDLRSKIEIAEQSNREQIANELRNELASREAEYGRVRQQLIEAEVEAEAAKSRLPEEEARLAQQLNDLQGQFMRLSSANAERAIDNEFSRAEQKLLNLQSEASARNELTGGSAPSLPKASHEETAEKQLQEMEARLGMGAQPPTAPQAPQVPQQADFLEFDAPPAKPSAEIQRPPLAIISDPEPEMETVPDGGTAELPAVAVESVEEVIAEVPSEELVQEAVAEEPIAEVAPEEELIVEAVSVEEEAVVEAVEEPKTEAVAEPTAEPIEETEALVDEEEAPAIEVAPTVEEVVAETFTHFAPTPEPPAEALEEDEAEPEIEDVAEEVIEAEVVVEPEPTPAPEPQAALPAD